MNHIKHLLLVLVNSNLHMTILIQIYSRMLLNGIVKFHFLLSYLFNISCIKLLFLILNMNLNVSFFSNNFWNLAWVFIGLWWLRSCSHLFLNIDVSKLIFIVISSEIIHRFLVDNGLHSRCICLILITHNLPNFWWLPLSRWSI